jgi:hypothetical protein
VTYVPPAVSDRLPDWEDANQSDPGVVIVELLAYAADLLAYYQEQIAAEAQLTSRRRYAVAAAIAVLALICLRRCRRSN